MVWSFLIFLGMFVAIGVSSILRSRGTKNDYYLASSDVPPSLVGLSAVATNNSGYMFIGVIGYTYATGFAAVWLMVSWIIGDFIASSFIHSRLRQATRDTAQPSYAGVLSNWHRQHDQTLQRLIALISLVFLMAYAGAQLVAGSKALHVLLDWPIYAGAVMGAIMVALYCMAGGIRASIWTDAAQSVVMIIAMGVMLVIATVSLGGIDGAIHEMDKVEGFLDLFPDDLILPGIAGGVMFALGWMFAGFSVIGQPHVMIRFMALAESGRMVRARIWYYLWFTAFYCMSTCVGLLSRVYLGGDPAGFDAELALPTMAMELLHPVFVGLVLAGIFAATMSTADSLVLNCSAAITHDLLPRGIDNTFYLKLTTIVIVFIALVWALTATESVFSLVIFAWSGLASAFAPLLIVLSLGFRPGQRLSIIAMLVGLAVALGWRFAGWHNAVYEGLPGIISGLMILTAVLWWRNQQGLSIKGR
ncbi:sodium/proline symporter [Methylophaga sp. OBS1]|uniref:sodium/proline symporter n=1 Tax=Methylophaga sp. OBS1 TaxID=2991933 RepID=UPI00225C1BFD|nr:sodium/proline symporter [Methylophaga sp. OBS1]MCX4190880.1 sodium/proline symporter [Methylophaga sp. OBS1]MCX4192173.1 sodium/proline symporter [Methylophaga sp. OBS1]